MWHALDNRNKMRLLVAHASHLGDWLFATPINATGLRMSNETIWWPDKYTTWHATMWATHTLVHAGGLYGLSCRRSAGRHARQSAERHYIAQSVSSKNPCIFIVDNVVNSFWKPWKFNRLKSNHFSEMKFILHNFENVSGVSMWNLNFIITNTYSSSLRLKCN